MFRSLWSAIDSLARSINALATSIDAAGAELRQRIGLPDAEAADSRLPLVNGDGQDAPVVGSAGRRRR